MSRDLGYHVVYPQIFAGIPADNPMVVNGEKGMRSSFDLLEKHYLADKNFVCGNNATVADIFLAVYVSLVEWLAYDLSPWPKVMTSIPF